MTDVNTDTATLTNQPPQALTEEQIQQQQQDEERTAKQREQQERVDGVLSRLRAKLAALGDGRDCGSDNAKATYFATYNTTQSVITALMNLPQDIARTDDRIAECEASLTQWTELHDALKAQLDAKVLDGEVHTSELERRQAYVQHFTDRLTALHQRRQRDASALEHNVTHAAQLLATAS